MKRKATVTVETERVLVISQSRGAIEHWCEECKATVRMIGVSEAAAIAGLPERVIFRLTETRKIHFTETAEGRSLFCIDSILEATEAAACQLPRAPRKNRDRSSR
ncbi:MAG TPA: hypothetical protein VGQ39_22915 [Pyrinomonadaceae bacterium]|jgi:hypothetical protein|nr:hypothetical protein [Pyrinomonadaceae bacterium]